MSRIDLVALSADAASFLAGAADVTAIDEMVTAANFGLNRHVNPTRVRRELAFVKMEIRSTHERYPILNNFSLTYSKHTLLLGLEAFIGTNPLRKAPENLARNMYYLIVAIEALAAGKAMNKIVADQSTKKGRPLGDYLHHADLILEQAQNYLARWSKATSEQVD
jgi:hypothetical protein